jgi:signal transduction histidine kinase
MTRMAAELRHPEGAWGWGGTSAAIAVAVLPQLVVQAIVPEARSAAGVASAAALVAYLVTAASGIYMYLHHRLTCSSSTAWLAAGTIFAAGFWLTVSGLDLATTGEASTTLLVGADVVVVGTLLLMVRVSERFALRFDPAAVGLLLAFTASAACILVARLAHGIALARPSTSVLGMLLVVLGFLLALEVHRLMTLPSWVRDRFAFAIILLVLGRACVVTARSDEPATYLIAATLLSTMAAVLFLSTSLATLRLAIHDDRIVISALQDQLALTAAQALADRERLHEVKGTIAGIASASRLIHHGTPIPGQSRERLEDMLEQESARLLRLVHGGRPGPLHEVDVDTVLRPLVVARQAQGQRVIWQPSGQRVWARADDLTVVVNVLLENSAQHAPGEGVAVFAQCADDYIQVVVADSGPGVAEEQRPTIFDREARRPCSPGEGLGLHVARRLMVQCGGYLRLDTSWLSGAAFVVGLRPATEYSEGRRDDTERIIAQ